MCELENVRMCGLSTIRTSANLHIRKLTYVPGYKWEPIINLRRSLSNGCEGGLKSKKWQT